MEKTREVKMDPEKFILTLDSSQIAEYLNCPYAWYLRYRQHLVRVSTRSIPILGEVVEDASALEKGIVFHELLATLYKCAAQGVPALVKAMELGTLLVKMGPCAISNSLKEINLTKEERQFLAERLAAYVIRYTNSDFVPKITEQSVGVEIGFSKLLYEDDCIMFIVEGRIDLLSEIQGEPCFVDHKWQDAARRLYDYRPQFLTYAWATGFKYGVYNYVRGGKEVGANTFERKLVHIPKWMVRRWEKKMYEVFTTIYHLLSYEGSRFEESRFQSMSNLGSCAGAYDSSPCQFTQICETQKPALVTAIKEMYYKEERWTPWELQS